MDAFKDKYGPAALVTGASSGIGECFAEALAARGLDLVLVARRIDRLKTLAARLEQQHHVSVTVCQVDLASVAAAAEILEATEARDIGLVVSNAGFALKGEHGGHAPADMTEMLMVNCHTPMQLTQGFIPRLKRRGKGGILLTSSIEAMLGVPYSAAYSASKGFVLRLGEALWGELTPEGIDVLTLCPGATATEALTRAGMDASKMPNVQSPAEVARLALENLAEGPSFIPSAHYRGMFEQLAAMPRRDALAAMAKGNRP